MAAQETTKTSEVLHPENQDYWNYCHCTYVDQSGTDIAKEKDLNKKEYFSSSYNKDKKHATKMDTLICNSSDMLKEFMDPKAKHQIPYDLLQSCRGIIFLRIWKAGIVLGGIGGTGIVMSNNNGTWSNPCAISVGGIQLGLNIGVERVDDILILRDDTALRMLTERGNFKLGADASIAAGPFGRDVNTGVAMSGDTSKSIYAYSFAKGAYIGISLDGGMMSVNDSVNEDFYGRKLSARDLLYGDILMQQHGDLFQFKQTLSNLLGQQKNIYTTTSSQGVSSTQNIANQGITTVNP